MNDPVVELAEKILVARCSTPEKWVRDEDLADNALRLAYIFYERASDFRKKYPKRP